MACLFTCRFILLFHTGAWKRCQISLATYGPNVRKRPTADDEGHTLIFLIADYEKPCIALGGCALT